MPVVPYQFKRTTVTGRAANTTTLPLEGTIAINVTDGIMYSTNGTVVFQVGSNLTSSHITGEVWVGNTTVNTTINSVSITTEVLSTLSILANGSTGSNGSYLAANSTQGVYWAPIPKITVSATAPSTPALNDLWVDTN